MLSRCRHVVVVSVARYQDDQEGIGDRRMDDEEWKANARVMPPELRDEVVSLRQWRLQDAAWYAECIQDPEVQRFTKDPPTLTAEDVATAISALVEQPERAAYLIADSRSAQRL